MLTTFLNGDVNYTFVYSAFSPPLRVLQLLSNIAAGKEEVNMTRMGNVVQRQILDTLSNVRLSYLDPVYYLCIKLIRLHDC